MYKSSFIPLKKIFFKFACTRSYLRRARALLPHAGSSQRHIGSSSLTWAPCLGSSVLTTGPPGKSLSHFKFYLRLFFLIYHFVYFFTVLGLCGCVGVSLVAASGGCSLVAGCGLIVVASLVGEHGL